MVPCLSPWDGVYCTLLAELNRRHKLDVLMEKWKNGVEIAKRDKEIVRSHNLLIQHDITAFFGYYWDAGEDKEETIRSIAAAMQTYGLQFFLKHHMAWLDDDFHDDDMYYSAMHLAATAYVREVSPHDDSIDLNDLP